MSRVAKQTTSGTAAVAKAKPAKARAAPLMRSTKTASSRPELPEAEQRIRAARAMLLSLVDHLDLAVKRSDEQKQAVIIDAAQSAWLAFHKDYRGNELERLMLILADARRFLDSGQALEEAAAFARERFVNSVPPIEDAQLLAIGEEGWAHMIAQWIGLGRSGPKGKGSSAAAKLEGLLAALGIARGKKMIERDATSVSKRAKSRILLPAR